MASRLKEATGRPAVVIGLDGDEGKGRDGLCPASTLGASIQKDDGGALLKGGGHRWRRPHGGARPAGHDGATGGALDKQGAGDLGPADLKLDGMLMPGAAVELIEQIEQAGPGTGAPAPRYGFPDLAVRFAKRVESHLK